MTRLLAVAGLRFKEGVAARLAWLVALAFVVGVGAALRAGGPDAAARAAMADRVALWSAWGLALVVAAVAPALGLPADVRTGAAQTLLSSPVSRFEVVLGGTLGYGALATTLLVAMAGAATLGMQAAGIGPAERAPVRSVVAAEVEGGAIPVVVRRGANAATFRFRIPDGVAPGEPLRIRFSPQRRVEARWDAAGVAMLSIHAPGGVEDRPTQVAYKAGTAFTAYVPTSGLRPGDDAELTFRRAAGGWSLAFGPGSVEIGGARRLYATSLLAAALCAAPLLFLLASIGSLGAARFGAPTAAVCAVFLFALFVGRGIVVDGARFIVDASRDASLSEAHRRGETGYAPESEITPGRVFLAKASLAAFEFVPRYDVFDKTDALVERRAPTLEEAGRAALAGLPAAGLLTILGWLLLRRRELAPG